MTEEKLSYKSAGVDIDAGEQAVELMKNFTRETFNSNVLNNIGGFGGFYSLKDFQDMQEPVLVGSTDGVGTKLMVAFDLDRHDTVGIDLVAMSVNDLICCGATPLFFLDYIATGKMIPDKMAAIVKGIADGCKQADCALIGGETAEMPDMYRENEYDLAGFAVGIVDKQQIIDGSKIKENDLVVALSSSGLHSNGYSLARKALGQQYAEEMLTPTRIYVKDIKKLLAQNLQINGIANITGGGIIEKLGRIIPDGLTAIIDKNSWTVPEIFHKIAARGIAEREMYRTFNMGVGMCLVVAPEDADKIQNGFIIGKISSGQVKVELC